MIALRNPKTGEEFTANESYARRATERGFVKVEIREAQAETALAEEKAKPEKKSRKAKDGGAE